MSDIDDTRVAAVLQCEAFLKSVEIAHRQVCLLLTSLEEADVFSRNQDEHAAWQEVLVATARSILDEPCSGLRQPSLDHIPNWALDALRSRGILDVDEGHPGEGTTGIVPR